MPWLKPGDNLEGLKWALYEKGLTLSQCAMLMDMHEKSLQGKLLGRSEFTYSEYKKLQLILPEYNVDYLLAKDFGDDVLTLASELDSIADSDGYRAVADAIWPKDSD